ncbi:cyanocobalamin reductase / alkylcobalamin dealkylase [Epinephelus fuscoguttatus]|uniref:cyanocobalamin reductase / alkylcobalamin dealkylase n=1 Tax=Epinephelus fuscoguttatus TaxID=293821 RepID=UPI0020D0FA16|nr:cyanocobalamin reductase / alkylcobalamin dealkylase [Epinephelus fuscoguttatus]
MAASTANVEGITRLLEDYLSKLGFEVYPLKVGWYNAVLSPTLRLAYPDDSLAVVVLSTPAMFEQAFLPFMEERGCQGLSDPIDQCVKHCVSSAVSKCFPGQEVDVRYDYELLPSRKPKFLAQTAAHVSGAAFYYQQSDVTDQPWAEKKMFGVCVHPRFGGWFAIRALLVFGDVTVGTETVQPAPPDCVPSREGRIQLLEAFNFHWQDWSYRDIVRPVQIYSQKQKDYFSTPPAQRFALLKSWGFVPCDSDQPAETSDAQSQATGHG